MTARRGSALLVVGVLLVVVNLPLAHSTWESWRLRRDGVDVTAIVTGTAELPPKDDPQYGVEFTFDRDIDPDQTTWSARVDRATFDDAVDTDQVRARVLPGSPSVYDVRGQVGTSFLWVITLVVDVVLLVVIWLARRFRPERELRLVALEDVQRCRPGSGLDRLDARTFVVTGEVSVIDDEGLVLDLGDRSVRIDLAGHRNPVGYQQPARVTGRLSESSP